MLRTTGTAGVEPPPYVYVRGEAMAGGASPSPTDYISSILCVEFKKNGGSRFSSADSGTSRENDNQSFSNTLGFATLPPVKPPGGSLFIPAFPLPLEIL